jgi:beta-galactosidase
VEVVLEPTFHWAKGDEAVGFKEAFVASNCDHLKCDLCDRSDESNPWKLIAEVDPSSLI